MGCNYSLGSKMALLGRRGTALPQTWTLLSHHMQLLSDVEAGIFRGAATLAYETVCSKPQQTGSQPDKPTALVVHGLLGSGRNWRTFARNLANKAASTSGRPWKMVMVDQRNHGASAGLPLHPPHSIEAAAGDLTNLVQTELGGRVPKAMLGHSLGGKIVLEFLRQSSQEGHELPQQVWVLDSPVGRWTSNVLTDTDKVINEILNIPLPVPSRRWLYEYMTERGYSDAIQQWLGSNLTPTSGGFKWAFDISGAAAMFNSYKHKDYWDLLQHPPAGVEVHIVRAANSDRWSKKELSQLEALEQKNQAPGEGTVKVHVLPDAGHWLHVENPNGLLNIILPHLTDA
ncbi:hypothetical protein WJX75_001833 [Coccomyxa subellipsoidea]|uniref:AB hydrolase-1 domain-containing protein n=1 Tax=Coccomyxa subellipsoidea TaxID=248742 RepID=A0ABR2YZX2_9CHLO